MLAVPLVLVALVLSTEGLETAKAVDAPARGSVEGPWALVDLSFVGAIDVPRPGTSLLALSGGELTVTGGVGVQLGSVRLSPTARFSIGPRWYFGNYPTATPFDLSWSPVALALAAPDLLEDQKVTGLRLTPVFGVTVPTTWGAFDGSVPATTISLAGQLERRFGPVELAYRLEGSTSRCVDAPPRITDPFGTITFACASSWAVGNTLFAEWFADPLFSFALGLGWMTRWAIRDLGAYCPMPNSCLERVVRATVTHQPSVQARMTSAFSRHVGIALDLHFDTGAYPFPSGVPVFGANFGAWFRTDAILQRNWLDR